MAIAAGGVMTWREQLSKGYPWQPLAFVALMAIFVLATLYGMFVAIPKERAAIEHGTATTAHAIAYKHYSGHGSSYTWNANLTWTDAQGHPSEQKELSISAHAAAVIGDGSDVEIRYVDDTAVIAMDVQHRVRDESNAPWVLGIFGICLLLGLYHWRRRLREWRAPAPVQW